MEECDHLVVELESVPVPLDVNTIGTAHRFICQDCATSAVVIHMISI